MSSPVVRAFDKKQRVATGRTMRDGSFKQFYPMKLTLNSEAEWRHLWKFRVKRVKFTVDTPTPAPVPAPVPAPAPAPMTTRSSAAVTVATPVPAPARSSTQERWTCPYCRRGPGNDHRMCICRGYNYSVEAWEIACGIRDPPAVSTFTPATTPTPTPPTPTPSSSSTTTFNKNDWKYSSARATTIPAGDYYIGDLCYVLSEDIYHKVFGGDNRDYESGLYTGPNNQFFLVDNTAYGDGLYTGSDGKEFGVDAGIIGICPVSLMAKDDGGGHIYKFNKPVRCVFKNGVFRFEYGYNQLVIDTAGYDEDAY
jgi:hypothetical protein